MRHLKIYIAIWILLLIALDVLSYIKMGDLSFCIIFALGGILAISVACISTFQEILHVSRVETHKTTLGLKQLKSIFGSLRLSSISQLEDYTPIYSFFACKIRLEDTSEFLGDSKKSLFFASMVYIFLTLTGLLLFNYKASVKLPPSESELELLKTIKFGYSIVYLGVSFLYATVYITIAMIIQKKNGKAMH